MVKDVKFKQGDKIVDYGRVYRIFRVDVPEKSSEDRILHFRPYFHKGRNGKMTCSIPSKNIDKTKIRKPIDINELKKVFKILKSKPEYEVDTNNAKEVLGENKPRKTAQIIKGLWMEKNDEDRHFTRTKKQAFKLLIARLSEEIAFVKDTTPQKAEESIRRALKA